MTLYERVGGEPFFTALVERFYRGVATDPVLAPMYPEDLAGARERLALFLVQYWGGPTTYSDQRGHPRLRMRHGRFVIDRAARDAWLGHIRAATHDAVAAAGLGADVEQELADYFEMGARSMVNAIG